MILLGNSTQDFIPVMPRKYKSQQAWINNNNLLELALRKRHMRAAERLDEHTKRLPPLPVGDHVRIPNQTGPAPNKWDRTGVVVEVRQFDQYVIRIDGSGRATVRNRKFLREFKLYKAIAQSPLPQQSVATGTPGLASTKSVLGPKSATPIRPAPLPETLTLRVKPHDTTPVPALPTPAVEDPAHGHLEHSITPAHPPTSAQEPIGQVHSGDMNAPATPSRPRRASKKPAWCNPQEWDLSG